MSTDQQLVDAETRIRTILAELSDDREQMAVLADVAGRLAAQAEHETQRWQRVHAFVVGVARACANAVFDRFHPRGMH